MASFPIKTPVSLLQEICVRRKITPKYDLLQIEGAVHDPTFKYRVTVGNISEYGSGQSKKKAKHAAAKNVLDKIVVGQAGSADEAETQNVNTQVLSPYDDGIPGNPVGCLQELCMARRLPPPNYEVTDEEGLPHERQFTIQCIIGAFKETGQGKSKKLAKRQAAFKMLQKLEHTPVEPSHLPFIDDDDEIGQKIAARFSGLKEGKIASLTNNHRDKVSLFHKKLKSCTGEQLSKLKAWKLKSHVAMHCIQFLQDIAHEQKFDVTYVDIEEKSLSGQYQCLVQLCTLPLAVCFGSGLTSKDAQAAAAYNALEYLRIMTH